MLPSQQELHALLDYDPLTGVLTWKSRPPSMFMSQRACSTWNSRYAGKRAFTAQDRKGYFVGAIHASNYRASRVIWKWMTGLDADEVDHKDGDNQNNRLNNLRDVTGQVNHKNMKTPVTNKSGHIGVFWREDKQRWIAYIGSRPRIILGHFTNLADAIAARKQAEIDNDYHPNHGR